MCTSLILATPDELTALIKGAACRAGRSTLTVALVPALSHDSGADATSAAGSTTAPGGETFISCPLDDSSHGGQAEGVGIFPRADALPHPRSKPVQDAIDRDGKFDRFPHVAIPTVKGA